MPANLLESLIVDSKLWYVGNPLPNCFQTRNPETEILTLKSKLLNGQKQKLSYWKKKKRGANWYQFEITSKVTLQRLLFFSDMNVKQSSIKE